MLKFVWFICNSAPPKRIRPFILIFSSIVQRMTATNRGKRPASKPRRSSRKKFEKETLGEDNGIGAVRHIVHVPQIN